MLKGTLQDGSFLCTWPIGIQKGGTKPSWLWVCGCDTSPSALWQCLGRDVLICLLSPTGSGREGSNWGVRFPSALGVLRKRHNSLRFCPLHTITGTFEEAQLWIGNTGQSHSDRQCAAALEGSRGKSFGPLVVPGPLTWLVSIPPPPRTLFTLQCKDVMGSGHRMVYRLFTEVMENILIHPA